MPQRYIKKILDARVYDVAIETPLTEARSLSKRFGNNILLKREDLQPVFSFKIRGAYNRIAQLSEEQKAKGVILASSGNFAQAFAFAGRLLDVPIAVVMLDETSPYKVKATQDHGAEVVFCADALGRQPMVEAVARERGMTAIDTWEEYWITAGHASIGLEVCEDFDTVQQQDKSDQDQEGQCQHRTGREAASLRVDENSLVHGTAPSLRNG